MVFGKRFSMYNNRAPPVIKQTCERCRGTGWVRERGSRIVCKPCNGTGKVDANKERAS